MIKDKTITHTFVSEYAVFSHRLGTVIHRAKRGEKKLVFTSKGMGNGIVSM